MHNGRASGNVAQALLDNDMDLNMLRPYRGAGGYTYVDKHVANDAKGAPIYEAVRVNNDSILPYEAWRLIDGTMVETARPKMRVTADMIAAGLVENIDAMSLTTLTYRTMTESGSARIVMDPAVHGERDRPKFGQRSMPVPFIEAEWSFNLREMNIAKRGGQPLDLTQIKTATRIVMETVEDLVLGTSATPFSYNGLTLPGILNFPYALAKVMTLPTAVGWTPATLYNEINEMRQQSIDNNYDGPWVAYFSSGWDIYLNKKYSSAYQSGTLRQEILALDGISGVRVLRRLSGYKVVLIQMTSDVFQLINGLPLRAIQWGSPDGWIVHGKIITSILPQPRYDAANQTGIVVGVAA